VPIVEGPGPIRLTGDKIQSVEIEGGDQIISGSEAGPQDRLVITVTVSEPFSAILNTDLFWDSPSGEPTQISNSDFLVEPEESTNSLRVSVNVYARQNGTTVETGDGLTELDIVLYSDGPNGFPVDSWRASIPLELSFGTAVDQDATAIVNPPDSLGDQQAGVVSYTDVLSESSLLLNEVMIGTDDGLDALAIAPSLASSRLMAAELNPSLIPDQDLPSQI